MMASSEHRNGSAVLALTGSPAAGGFLRQPNRKQSVPMNFSPQETKPGCLVLTCDGKLSWEDRESLVGYVEQRLKGVAGGQVILDFAAVEFVNSAGLGALFQLIQSLQERDGRLWFASVPPSLARLFRMVGLDRLALISDDVPAALRLLAAEEQARPAANVEPAANTTAASL